MVSIAKNHDLYKSLYFSYGTLRLLSEITEYFIRNEIDHSVEKVRGELSYLQRLHFATIPTQKLLDICGEVKLSIGLTYFNERIARGTQALSTKSSGNPVTDHYTALANVRYASAGLRVAQDIIAQRGGTPSKNSIRNALAVLEELATIPENLSREKDDLLSKLRFSHDEKGAYEAAQELLHYLYTLAVINPSAWNLNSHYHICSLLDKSKRLMRTGTIYKQAMHSFCDLALRLTPETFYQRACL